MTKALGAVNELAVTAIDVVDHNVTDVPLLLYDGRTLPFDDKAFDVSLLVFVLHHAADPEVLLREAVRVTRSTVLVVEDAPSNLLERGLWRVWDYLLNHGAHDDIAVAHRARSKDQWRTFLKNEGLPTYPPYAFRTFFPVLCSYPHALFAVQLDSPGPVTGTRD